MPERNPIHETEPTISPRLGYYLSPNDPESVSSIFHFKHHLIRLPGLDSGFWRHYREIKFGNRCQDIAPQTSAASERLIRGR